MMKRIFTSESVTEGHPDKVCDQISDGVLDAILAQDPMARVACETVTATGMVLVAGQITCDCYVDIAQVARRHPAEHRLRLPRGRLQRQHLRRADRHRRAVQGHRHGRGRGL